MLRLPSDKLLAALRSSGQNLTEEEQQEFLAGARHLIETDPLLLEQPISDNRRDGQIIAMRGGANLETTMLMCGITGAFPYTNMRTRWQEILSLHDELSETARIWTPLAKSFQSLQFRFLNNVDPRFAKNIREDGRLEQFRTLLRKIGKGANEVNDLGRLDSFARDCSDELISEFHKAEADWSKIDEDLLKWGGASIGGAMLAGSLTPNISALSAAALAGLGQLGLRYFKRDQFRKQNPMSVFIDLSNKPTSGTVIF